MFHMNITYKLFLIDENSFFFYNFVLELENKKKIMFHLTVDFSHQFLFNCLHIKPKYIDKVLNFTYTR